MSVAKTNQIDKPSSASASSFSAAQAAREEFNRLASQLETSVESAAAKGETFDEVERAVFATAQAMGFQAMRMFVSLQGDGDCGESVTTSQGKCLVRSEEPARTTIRSIFGSHEFNEFTYARGRKKAIELRSVSARMSLPKSQWSNMLQEFSQMLCADQAYGLATSNLGQILGGKFSVDTVERINGQMGVDAGEFLDNLPMPEPGSEGKLMVATADCKGVPLVKEDVATVAAFETAKKNPGNRKMATVASVYSVDPYVRTAEEITEALFRESRDDERSDKPKRPIPQNKNTTAHFPDDEDDGSGSSVAISGILFAMAWIMEQVARRRRRGQVLVVLMDGQKSLWDAIKLHLTFGARTVPILDILHAVAYVWEAAGLFEKDDAVRKAFTRRRLLRILKGEVLGVVRGLRQLGTTRKLSGKQLADLIRICSYLESNANRMRYHEYLRRGYPIASGVIEGACRHLVKDRMERSGMRWTLEGARSMLNVRAAFQSDHWRSFLDSRIEKELAATHPHRDLLTNYVPFALAC